MNTDKFNTAKINLSRFEKLYGKELMKIFSIANGYISRELTDGMIAGIPQRVQMSKKQVWTIPIMLSEKTGIYGEIGGILIDGKTHDIIGYTPTSEVIDKAEALVHDKAKAA